MCKWGKWQTLLDDVCPLSILKGDYRVLNKKSRRTYVLQTSFNFYPNVCPFLLKSCRRRHRRLRSSTSVTAAAARLLLSTKRPKLVWSRIKNRNILNSQFIPVLWWCLGCRNKYRKTRINWLFDSSLQLSLSKISLETKSWDIQTIRSWKEYLLNLLKTT